MIQYTCNICKKIFTRDWNFRRHIHDVRGIKVNTNTDNSNLDDTKYSNNPKANNNFFLKDDKQYNNNYNQNPYRLDDFHGNISNTTYPSSESIPFLEWDVPIKEKERLTSDEIIKIQKILKKLTDHLLQCGYPTNNVLKFVNDLNFYCIIKKSDEPLKKFLTLKMLGHFWE